MFTLAEAGCLGFNFHGGDDGRIESFFGRATAGSAAVVQILI
jgi:hypothetical protein